MNMTLTVLNAAALAALVAFHFQDTRIHEDQINSRAQSHESIRQAPQLAVITDRGANAAMLSHEVKDVPQVIRAQERWVF